jgi:outer membrane protein OmpA-like peptidoglycan-associated protein
MGAMRAIRLLTTTICFAGLFFGAAQATPSIVVNYDVLDRLPAKSASPGVVAPQLTPLGLVRRHAVPAYSPFAGNDPLGVGNAVPPIFERPTTLYNGAAPGFDETAAAAFGSQGIFAQGVTGATRRPAVMPKGQQETAMLAPAYGQTAATSLSPASDAEDDSYLWIRARRMGEVLFKNDGYDVVDVDRNSLSQLDRLARKIGVEQQRILLRAFGGVRGDDSHQAHLVALRRGLAIRRYLIERGVSSSLIDVTAVGGATDGGPLDRVDVVASNS